MKCIKCCCFQGDHSLTPDTIGYVFRSVVCGLELVAFRNTHNGQSEKVTTTSCTNNCNVFQSGSGKAERCNKENQKKRRVEILKRQQRWRVREIVDIQKEKERESCL